MYIPKHKHPAYNKEASGWMDEIFKVSLWGVAHQRCVLSTSAVHTVFKSVVNLGSGSVTVYLGEKVHNNVISVSPRCDLTDL